MKFKLSKIEFRDWNAYEISWMCIFTLTIIISGIISHDKILDIISGVFGVINIVLCAKGKYSNYYFGIVYVVSYSYIAFSQKLYASGFLFACYFLPMQFLGLYWWKKHQSHKNGIRCIKINSMRKNEFIWWVLLIVIFVLIVSKILNRMNDPFPLFDAGTSILSIVGMYWMTRRLYIQWYIWFISNCFTIIIWSYVFIHMHNGHISQLIMNIAFILNNFYGLYNWKRAKKRQK